jgi:hypothetical protein
MTQLLGIVKGDPLLRKILYPGVAAVIYIPLAFAVQHLDQFLYRATFWGIDVEGIIVGSLYALAMCLGFAIASRSLTRQLIAIPSAAVIGLLSHKGGEAFITALYPSEYEVGLGALGQLIDRSYPLTFGYSMGDLVGNFLANVLIALFLASFALTLKSFLAGSLAGSTFSIILLISGFLKAGVMTIDGTFQLVLLIVLLLPLGFARAAAFSGVVIMGQLLPSHLPTPRPRPTAA